MFDVLEIASALGENVVSPGELFSDDDGRISSKTGILKLNRTDDSALQLAERAMEKLGCLKNVRDDVSVLIYVTQSPSNFLPNHASLLQARFGISGKSMCFDINQGCSGFVQGLLTAISLLNNAVPIGAHALIVCADTYSHHLARDDRSTQALFSDGASVTVIRKGGPWKLSGVSNITDGSGADFLTKPVDPTVKLAMNGAAVFQWTRRVLGRQILDLLASTGLGVEQIDAFYIHQASKLVMENVAKGLGVPSSKFPTTLHLTGNLVSSAIPYLLENEFSRFREARNVVLAGFGVGLSSSACLLQQP